MTETLKDILSAELHRRKKMLASAISSLGEVIPFLDLCRRDGMDVALTLHLGEGACPWSVEGKLRCPGIRGEGTALSFEEYDISIEFPAGQGDAACNVTIQFGDSAEETDSIHAYGYRSPGDEKQLLGLLRHSVLDYKMADEEPIEFRL